MRRCLSICLVSGLSLTLAACASVPSQDQLVSGIDKTQLAQASATKRAPSDPVCVDFYTNVAAFQKKAQSNKGTKNFLSAMGLNVASAVLVGQIVPTGISSQAGQIAATTAASTATRQGGMLAIRELNSSKRADRKIIDVASEIGCPVSIKP